jgi:hypothetical protein
MLEYVISLVSLLYKKEKKRKKKNKKVNTNTHKVSMLSLYVRCAACILPRFSKFLEDAKNQPETGRLDLAYVPHKRERESVCVRAYMHV